MGQRHGGGGGGGGTITPPDITTQPGIVKEYQRDTNVLDFRLGFDGEAQGDVMVRGAGSWERLPAGAGGDVLTSNGPGATPSYQAPPGASSAPTGAILMWPTDTPPSGYLLCDGQEVSRATYATLFALIGETFGVGDGSSTFNVPNMKGRVPVGKDAGQTEFDSLAETGGAKTHTLTTGEMPSHTHTQDAHNHTQNAHTHTQDAHSHGENGPTSASGGAGTIAADTNSSGSAAAGINTATAVAVNQNTTATNQEATAVNQSTGGGGAHNNLQPYLVLNYIIKT